MVIRHWHNLPPRHHKAPQRSLESRGREVPEGNGPGRPIFFWAVNNAHRLCRHQTRRVLPGPILALPSMASLAPPLGADRR